jgi:hypothetical protein
MCLQCAQDVCIGIGSEHLARAATLTGVALSVGCIRVPSFWSGAGVGILSGMCSRYCDMSANPV